METNAILLVLAFGIVWYAFQKFSNWLVGKFMPYGRKEGIESHRHFIAGVKLLEGSDKNSANFRAAIEQFDAALKADPSDVSVRLIKAVTLEQMGDINGCLNVLNEALDSGIAMDISVKSDALLKRGSLLLFKKRRPDAALKDFQLALRYAPTDARCHFLIGSCYEAKRSFPRALEGYKQALALDNSMEDAQQAILKVQGLLRESSRTS